MLARPILPSVLDVLPDEADARDPFTIDARRAHLDEQEQRRANGLRGMPHLSGLHVFTGDRGSGVSMLAGTYAYLYHAAGRTVFSNANLLYGHAFAEPVTDAFSLVVQAPDDCVLYLDDLADVRSRPRPWSPRQMAQALDDAAARRITILLVPWFGGGLPHELDDRVFWIHKPWQPGFVERLSRQYSHIPRWAFTRELVNERAGRDFLTVKYRTLQNPLGIRSTLLVSAMATQWFGRTAENIAGHLDPDRAIDFGVQDPEETYLNLLRRGKERYGGELTAPVLRVMDWSELERKY